MSRKNYYVYSDDAIDRSMDHGCGREDVNTGEWTACSECADGPMRQVRGALQGTKQWRRGSPGAHEEGT